MPSLEKNTETGPKTSLETEKRSVEKFLGDKPGSVITRLIFISLIVGAVMALLGLSPRALVDSVLRFARSIWAMGFDAIHEVSSWLIAGAVIVVPLWLIARLLRGRNS